MKIYNITKGQLITLWVFGSLGFLYFLDSYSNEIWSLVIVFILVFYTIGWRNYRKKIATKNDKKESEE